MSRTGLWTLLLAWVGGCVDAVGFLTLFHLFTAHMSGNSVWFGAAVGIGNWRLGLHHLFPIPLFVIGVAIAGGGAPASRAHPALRELYAFALPIAVLTPIVAVDLTRPGATRATR